MKTAIRVNTFKPIQSTSALCKAANVTRGQLRLYEEQGLITPQGRTEAGYRQYGNETLDRLKAIMHLKELSFTLAEISLLLSERDQGEIDKDAIQRLATQVLYKIDGRIRGLQIIRDYVAPVAAGDTKILEDEECKFIVEYLSALSVNTKNKPNLNTTVLPASNSIFVNASQPSS